MNIPPDHSPESSAAPGQPLSRSEMLNRLSLAAIILVLDQLSKAVVRFILEAQGQDIAVMPVLNIVRVMNPGAAFGFLAWGSGWQNWVLGIFAVLVMAWIIFALMDTREHALSPSGLTLILGGAMGNFIDRLRYGAVFDFIDVHLGSWHFPAFNIADAAITLGVGLIFWQQGLAWRRSR